MRKSVSQRRNDEKKVHLKVVRLTLFVGDESGHDGDGKHEHEAGCGQVHQVHILAICHVFKGNTCIEGYLLHGILKGIDVFLQCI